MATANIEATLYLVQWQDSPVTMTGGNTQLHHLYTNLVVEVTHAQHLTPETWNQQR